MGKEVEKKSKRNYKNKFYGYCLGLLSLAPFGFFILNYNYYSSHLKYMFFFSFFSFFGPSLFKPNFSFLFLKNER